jgi:hypothetical protein
LLTSDLQDFSIVSSRANLIKDIKSKLKTKISEVRKILVSPPGKDSKLLTPPAGATFLALANKLGVGVDILKPSEGPVMKVDYPKEYEKEFEEAISAWGSDMKVQWTGKDGKELESVVRVTVERPPRSAHSNASNESAPAERFAALVSISGFPHEMLGSTSWLVNLLALFNTTYDDFQVLAWGRMERDVPLPFNVVRIGLRRVTSELAGVTRMVSQGSTPIFFAWSNKSICTQCGLCGHSATACPHRFTEELAKAKSPQRWFYLDEDRYAPPPAPSPARPERQKPPLVVPRQAQPRASSPGTNSSTPAQTNSKTNNRFAALASTVEQPPSSATTQAAANKSRSGQRNSSKQPASATAKPAQDPAPTNGPSNTSSKRSASSSGEQTLTAGRRSEAKRASVAAEPQPQPHRNEPTRPASTEKPSQNTPRRTPQPAQTVPASPKAVTLSKREVSEIWDQAYNEAELTLKTSQYASPADYQSAKIAYAKERSTELQEQACVNKARKLALRTTEQTAAASPPPPLLSQQSDRAPQVANQPRGRSGSSASH